MARLNPSLLALDRHNGDVAAAAPVAVAVSQPARIGMAEWCVAAIWAAS